MTAPADDAEVDWDLEQLRNSLVGARLRKRVTVEEMSRRMSCSVLVVQKLETPGQDTYLSTLQRYARALGGQVVLGMTLPDRDPK